VAALWLVSGVRVGEIARFVPYELGFVVLPGWLAYRALMSSPGGRLRQLVLGWTLGYLLEIAAFISTAAIGVRELFVVYPVIVGLPAAWIARRRRRGGAAATAHDAVPAMAIWAGALLCTLLVLYAAGVGFAHTPLPRDVSSTTYQEDTVFTISVAAEALHHWPVTLPVVAGEPLHYHLFAYLHMAAITQVTGIDLSVVVMRLYVIPLLVLFALQLIWAGRLIGRSLSAGLAAAFVVLFLGELDASRTTRFLFNDSFFYWLLGSHTFLLGLAFFVPAVVLLNDLITSKPRPGHRRVGTWLLAAALLVGCVGAKSYALVEIAAGLFVFVLWRLWRDRMLNRPALLALVLSVALNVAASALVFRWNSAGAVVSPLKAIKGMRGAEDLVGNLERLWGSTDVSWVLGVAYGTVGLLGVPLLGIGLLLRYRRFSLTQSEVWLLSLFVAALPVLFLLTQPGRGQFFFVFFGVVPGAMLAAGGFRLFWAHRARESLGPAAIVGLAACAGLLVAQQLAVTALVFLVLAGVLVTVFAVRPAHRQVLGTAAVGGCLVLGLLNTPLDWFPTLAGKSKDIPSAQDQGLTGLTAGLYQGLLWIRGNTDSSAVLAVSNHSIYPDNRDSKYFYYSAFAERRVVLESWDYTPQTAAQGKFSLDAAHTPFPRRLRLSDAAIRGADEIAMRTLARDYGARYLVVDKVHGTASRWLPARARHVFANGDIDVYALGRPSARPSVCPDEQGAGIAAVFGHRRTVDAAHALRRSAERVGFPGLTIQQRGCRDYAVVLTGLQDFAQAKDFQRQAATVDFHVRLECRTQAPEGGLNAVFGHRRTKRAAQELAGRANAVGFLGLDVRQDVCNDWEVDLEGLRTAAQRREFRAEAASVGFRIAFEPG
jgi:hypothetical protein